MISIKEYIARLENVRNEFYAVNNIEAAELVQADINKLILSEINN